MGNSANYNNETKHRHKNSPTEHVDEFIVKLHNYQQKYGIINNISRQQILLDQRRVVFVSLLGLYQTYFLCPAPILYSAILILPIKNEWIFCSYQYKNELNKSIIKKLTIFQNEAAWNNFVCLLQWKDSQNLVIWADNPVLDDAETLVSQFWTHFNSKLTTLYDPTTKSTYNPIIFDRKWWQFDYDLSKSKYKTSRYKILKELFFSTKEFKPMMEIIYQSNPSLNPIVSYQAPVQFVEQYLKHTSAKFMVLSESQNNGFINTFKNDMDNDGYVTLNNESLCADIIENKDDKTEDLYEDKW
eukprot:895503_1